MSPAPPNPRTAFWLSVLVPGLGLLYAGAPWRAAVVLVLALVSAGGIADSAKFMDTRPEFYYYGFLATAVLVSVWWGGAWHAQTLATRFRAWPALYRLLARRELWRALRPAGVEIGMAVFFAILVALYTLYPKHPHWVPDVPRYWFLYELVGAAYVLVAIKARPAVFFALTTGATFALAFATSIPKDTLAFAYLLSLPSCLESLRSEAARLVNGYRFAACLVSAFLALFAYSIVVWIAELVMRVPQYKLRLAMDPNLSVAAFAIHYYLIRAGFSVLIGKFPPGDGAGRR